MKDDRKKRRGPFDDDFGFFNQEWERIHEMMDRMTGSALRDRENFEPFVYGFSVRTGPDGKPVFQRFGDSVGPGEEIREGMSREPLTDIIERDDSISVTIELPGIEKKEIDLDIIGRRMTVKVDAPNRRYQKVVDLPCTVDEESVKATFKNGVLDVNMMKSKGSESHQIGIE
jgi:HSP20 family protein